MRPTGPPVLRTRLGGGECIPLAYDFRCLSGGWSEAPDDMYAVRADGREFMKPDPIVEEIHAIREAIGNRFNNDLMAICDDARKRQAQSPRRVVKLPPRRIAQRPAKAE